MIKDTKVKSKSDIDLVNKANEKAGSKKVHFFHASGN